MTGNVKAVPSGSQSTGLQSSADTAEKYTYSDLIVDYLAQIGVEYVFGIQGGAIEPFYNAIARRRRKGGMRLERESTKLRSRKRDTLYFGPKPIFSRHETGAAFMADGYYRETGKLGVCCATTGPGSTNLLTGVSSAYAENTPMLVITPQTSLPEFGRKALQESSADAIDVVSMFEHCTRYNTLVTHSAQISIKLHTAITRAFQHPRGPVHLSIPRDILDSPVVAGPLIDVGMQIREQTSYDEEALSLLVKESINAKVAGKKVLFVVGKRCSGLASKIERIAEYMGSLIISTPTGKRWINSFHPLYRGVFGYAGHQTARDALEDPELELIVVLGSQLDETETGGWDEVILNDKMIHVSCDPEDFLQSSVARLHVLGNLQSILSNFLSAIEMDQPLESGFDSTCYEQELSIDVSERPSLPMQIKHDTEEVNYRAGNRIKPQALMACLAGSLPCQTRFHIDAGNSWAWSLHYLHTVIPGGFRISTSFGSMGWAIGASVGAALGSRNSPIVCITGDGSWLMAGQEFTVAVELGLPVLFVVLNDSSYGMVRHGQQLGSAEQLGWQIPQVDFAGLAESLGGRGIAASTMQELEEIDFSQFANESGPTILDVRIDANEVPPMRERMRVLMGSDH